MRQIQFKTFDEFQAFTFHKQLRFNFKILKRIELENSHHFLSHWDTTSIEIEKSGLLEFMKEDSSNHISLLRPDITSMHASDVENSDSGEDKY